MIIWRFSILVLCLVVFYIWVIWMRGNAERWRYAVLPLSYILHVIAFTVCAHFQILPPEELNIWSNGVRIHSLLFTGAVGILLIYIGRGWIWKLRK